jgi:hypothetical protein
MQDSNLHLEGILKAVQLWKKRFSALRISAEMHWQLIATYELCLLLWCLLVCFSFCMCVLSKGSCLLNTIRIELFGANPPSDANSLTADQLNQLLRNPTVYYHVAILTRRNTHYYSLVYAQIFREVSFCQFIRPHMCTEFCQVSSFTFLAQIWSPFLILHCTNILLRKSIFKVFCLRYCKSTS